MRRIWCVLLFLIGALLLAAKMSEASGALRVDEAATRLLFHSDRAETLLAVQSSLPGPVTARVKLELISQLNRSVAKVEREVLLKPGSNTVAAEFQLEPSNYVLWRRLRYHVTTVPGFDAGTASGVISLSQICPDIFQLKLIKPGITPVGTRYHVRVRAEHPVTFRPTEGVSLVAELVFEELPSLLSSSRATDAEGYAVFDFDLPAVVKSDGEIKLTGTRNGLSAHVEDQVRVDRTIRISISTDKNIYQPGQKLHVRALVVDPSKRALGGAEVTLRILDPDDTVVHRASLKTSRFGIASDDWAVPANIRLGDYQIKIGRDESDEEDAYTPSYKVRISRYELPNFAVHVKPDREFYLPGQNAEVEVRGDYLFGQPVTRARVRVVRETEREWNYREQKWDITEEEEYQGELDQSGRFVANVDLSKQHDGLAERDYKRFNDISYAAYITDLTTSRTEQRRFDLRLSREPIHVYVIDDGNKVPGEPFNLFVSTSYADGTPAECEVEISQNLPVEAGDIHISRSRRIRTIKTNRYGVAQAAGIVIADTEEKPAAVRRFRDAELDFAARSRDGQQGHTSESVWYSVSNLIRVETDKALYKPGESIEVQVTATGRPSTLFIDVAQRWKIVHSQTISLVNGHGSLTLPYRKEFMDEVSIAAYEYTKASDFTMGTRTVLFPRRHELKLDVNMSQSQYQPGEEATVAFQVQTGSGQATEGALGVTVIDRAVEERARTDTEFAGYDFATMFHRLWGYEGDIAGVTLRSLERLDLSKAVPADLQLAAEILLLRRGYWLDERGTSIGSPEHEFERILASQLKPVKSALDSRYARKRLYPSNAAMLISELADFGLDFPEMRDPWGLPYIPKFSVSRDRDVLTLVSAGPDKQAGSRDDFSVAEMSWPYFRPLGEMIDRAVQQHHDRAGSFIRDRRSLKLELLRDAINIDTLRDRWGKPYRFDFGVSGNYFTVEVKSSGRDRRFDAKGNPSADDFTVWTSKVDYFTGIRAKINTALASYFKETNRFPQQEAELKEALGRESIDWENLRDPWGNRYHATFKAESRYSDRIRMISFAQYLGEARQRTEVTPVTQRINFIYLRSSGKDGKEGTPDDFEAANYLRVVAEQSSKNKVPEPPSTPTTYYGVSGAIAGVVVDPNGAVIANAVVKATHKSWATGYEAKTNDDGRYLLGNLTAGLYEVSVSASGFTMTVITDVPVNSSNVTELNATLMVGTTAEVVNVTAETMALQTQVSELKANLPAPSKTRLAMVTQSTVTSTPRLREYFPETLLWQPSLETDASGRARLAFKLADNITTWKMSVIASTEDGEIGTAEKEILAFQPFFIEHDPPRVLTEGDQIALPVVLRNYLDKSQTVDLEIKPEPWFTVVGPARKRSEIAARDSAREVFDLKAVASVDDGKQRVTATASEASDAVEKPVSVHPHGQELTQTASQVFSDSGSITLTVPEAAIPGSVRAELKIYPNLMAQVIESIEGIMRRPYGCAEQTISSAYPSLLLLRYFKSKADQSSALAQKARRYVESAYERLLNYRDDNGGFTYWGRGDGDPALTAYALRFLTDAREFAAVDEDAIKNAREWLINHQRADGSWPSRFTTEADRLPAASRTAFICRVLASTSKGDADEATSTASVLRRVLSLLSQRIDEIDEPYLIASYALAAMSTDDKEGAARAIEKLRLLAHDEGDASYWKLETNTPFYGWGFAGQIEATALAVHALASFDEAGVRLSQTGNAAPRSTNELVNRGLLFLLRQKDRDGVWYSTQATVNVLDSLMAVLAKRAPDGPEVNSQAEVLLNDKGVASIPIPAGRLSEPILTDISRFLSTGRNRIQIRRPAGSPQANAQVVESHYERWPEMADAAKRESASAGALRLRVSFDKTQAKIGDEINCTVQAERVGFRGYGMMLAEIGLPPGADVDRASLERAVKEASWGVEQYDILPDRLIVYLWPEAGGTRFQFKFRPRFGMVAHSAPSVAYDYYNPEARAVVAPARFTIQ